MGSVEVPLSEACRPRKPSGQACGRLIYEMERHVACRGAVCSPSPTFSSSKAEFQAERGAQLAEQLHLAALSAEALCSPHSSPLDVYAPHAAYACIPPGSSKRLCLDAGRDASVRGAVSGAEPPLNDTVRYGIIGTGMMGVEHVYNLAVVEGARITAIADTNEQSRENAINAIRDPALQVFRDHKALLDSGVCDVVIVATPNMTHVNILLDMLSHPRSHHVLVEKPLCIDVEQCEQVLTAANARKDILVQVGLEYRYMPPVARLLAEVKKGSVGKVHMVAIREHRFPFLVKVDNWNRFNRNTGGTLVEKCCHFFDLMTLIMGRKPKRVIASGSQAVNHLEEVYGEEQSDILDNAYVIVEYEGGGRGVLDLCMFAEGSRNEQEISVVGSSGKVEALVPESIVRIGSRAGGREGVQTIEVHDERIKYEGLHHGSSYLEHLDFIKAVQSHGTIPPAVNLREGLLSVAIGVAAHKSIATGLPVMVDDVMREAKEIEGRRQADS